MARMLPYDSTWEDMSDYVVHFTRPEGSRSDYDNMLNICWERVLKPGGAFGLARDRAPEPKSQFAVCMSEIPLHQLRRLAKRRGEYAIGFKKHFILSRGGGPIWYVEKGGTIASAINALIDRAQHSPQSAVEPLWTLTPFVDVPGDYSGKPYRFEWEREWRHVGELRFSEADVGLLVLPEGLHEKARRFFVDHEQGGTGPAYLCPYIDASWNRKQIRSALFGSGT
jgi:hypothetical protein